VLPFPQVVNLYQIAGIDLEVRRLAIRPLEYSTDIKHSYWEPAWLNNTGLGSACQDAILFEPDWSHYPNVTAYSRKSVNLFNQ
jgi:hypothetical protein